MEIAIHDITDIEKEIRIEAGPAELTPKFEQAYKDYAPKVEIDGFRKGKAPLALVKRIYGESIEYNALDKIANEFFREVIAERDIRPIGEPVLTDINYDRGGALKFAVKYEIKPVFELREYTNLPVEKLVHKVTDKEIDAEILRIRRANHTLEAAERAADTEYLVTADVQEADDSGTPMIGKKTEGAKFYLADEQIPPEIRDGLMNATPGDLRKITMKHEHDGHTHTDNLQITVKTVERVVLPALDDEMAAKVTKGKVTTAGDFRTKLTEDLESYWKSTSDRRLTDTIVAEIVRRHDVTVPESLIRGIQDSLIEDIRNRYPNKKLPADFNEETFRENNRGYAAFQAKWFLIRERIMEAEKISVDDADIEKLAERDAPSVGIDKERLLQFYRSSAQVKDRLVSEKLMDLLRTKQVITENVTEDHFE